MTDADDIWNDMIESLTADGHDRQESLVEILQEFDDPHEALAALALAMTVFLADKAPNMDAAMGSTGWMMLCVGVGLETLDREKQCNWNETRQ
jgi:hypothetical protein